LCDCLAIYPGVVRGSCKIFLLGVMAALMMIFMWSSGVQQTGAGSL